jgi:hypothetical protein
MVGGPLRRKNRRVSEGRDSALTALELRIDDLGGDMKKGIRMALCAGLGVVAYFLHRAEVAPRLALVALLASMILFMTGSVKDGYW